MTEKEQQFERIYEKTKDFGRTQFVREIQMQINDNKKKDKKIKELQKKAELVEHYKYLYSEVKKQKDELETSYDILQKNNTTLAKQKEEAYKIADDYYKENQQLKKQKDELEKEILKLKKSIKLFTDDLANMTNQALELEKQKDDVVELIKKQLLSNTNITKYTDEMCLRDVLRMLGEIDD